MSQLFYGSPMRKTVLFFILCLIMNSAHAVEPASTPLPNNIDRGGGDSEEIAFKAAATEALEQLADYQRRRVPLGELSTARIDGTGGLSEYLMSMTVIPVGPGDRNLWVEINGERVPRANVNSCRQKILWLNTEKWAATQKDWIARMSMALHELVGVAWCVDRDYSWIIPFRTRLEQQRDAASFKQSFQFELQKLEFAFLSDFNFQIESYIGGMRTIELSSDYRDCIASPDRSMTYEDQLASCLGVVAMSVANGYNYYVFNGQPNDAREKALKKQQEFQMWVDVTKRMIEYGKINRRRGEIVLARLEQIRTEFKKFQDIEAVKVNYAQGAYDSAWDWIQLQRPESRKQFALQVFNKVIAAYGSQSQAVATVMNTFVRGLSTACPAPDHARGTLSVSVACTFPLTFDFANGPFRESLVQSRSKISKAFSDARISASSYPGY